jgi:hypothetical protein
MTDKPEKTTPSPGGDNITVGDISNATGIAVGRGASASVTQYSSGENEAIAKAFGKLYQALEEKPDTPEKVMSTQAVKGLEEEARKGEKADQENVGKWFSFLMTMLPDIGEVAINTFINPIGGLSTAFQKVAQKAKEHQQKEAE